MTGRPRCAMRGKRELLSCTYCMNAPWIIRRLLRQTTPRALSRMWAMVTSNSTDSATMMPMTIINSTSEMPRGGRALNGAGEGGGAKPAG